ncbi:MAG: vitamin K epoxide reductase family protein [Spirochaetota bacterium]
MHNKKILLAMITTCVVALIDSLYLLYVHYFPLMPNAPLFALCTAGTVFDCNAVNTSAYAMLLGLPLSAWGAFFYLFFIALVVLYSKNSHHILIEFGMVWLAVFAVLLSAFLGFISFVKIKKFCSFCSVLWVGNAIILVLVGILISRVYNGLRNALTTIHDFDIIELLRDNRVQKSIMILSIAGIVSLACAYGLTGVFEYVYKQKEKEREEKLIQEFKKDYEQYEKVTVNLDDIEPFTGVKENPVHIVVFFDFNCGACHRAITVLNEIAKKYNDAVALYLRHFPLDGACNRFIEHTKDGASCRASKIAYALYGSKAYHEYVMKLMSYTGNVDDVAVNNALAELKIEYNAVKKLLQNVEIRRKLQKDIELGGKLKIHATPTIIINNTMLKPGIPPAYLIEMAIKIEMKK